jgi:hypothetical protein
MQPFIVSLFGSASQNCAGIVNERTIGTQSMLLNEYEIVYMFQSHVDVEHYFKRIKHI